MIDLNNEEKTIIEPGAKIIVASDIHGSAYYCKKLTDRYAAEGASRLVLLGDLLYHGPRNALPQDYDCPTVIDMLNGLKDSIISVRGNCDSEVDQMVLDFPIMASFAVFEYNGITFFATHGHFYGISFPPKFEKKYIMLAGHTHIPECLDCGKYVYCNPGSVSIPKGDSERGYILIDGDSIIWKTLDGEPFHSVGFSKMNI